MGVEGAAATVRRHAGDIRGTRRDADCSHDVRFCAFSSCGRTEHLQPKTHWRCLGGPATGSRLASISWRRAISDFALLAGNFVRSVPPPPPPGFRRRRRRPQQGEFRCRPLREGVAWSRHRESVLQQGRCAGGAGSSRRCRSVDRRLAAVPEGNRDATPVRTIATLPPGKGPRYRPGQGAPSFRRPAGQPQSRSSGGCCAPGTSPSRWAAPPRWARWTSFGHARAST